MEHVCCNLCGADDPVRRHRKSDLDISRCRRCGLVYAGPRRVTAEESQARYSTDFFEKEYLPALGVVDGRFDLEHFDARYAHFLDPLTPSRRLGTLLEVGTGAGFFLKAAERRGWKVTGLEVMESGVRFAREHLGLDVRPDTLEKSSLASGTYDVVVMLDVIEHLSDPGTILSHARRLLRGGGVLLIFTPNYDALSRRALGSNWSVLSPVEHLYYFTESTLRSLLRESGLDDVRFDRRQGDPVVYASLNPAAASDPTGLRARAYRWLVDQHGTRLLPHVQRRGLSDALTALASAP